MVKTKNVDCAVIGAGAAGMAASKVIAENGFHAALIDREHEPGGILLQCIHNGFGLHRFGRELTGPEYAAEFSDAIEKLPVELFVDTTVVDIVPGPSAIGVVTCSAHNGVLVLRASAVVLAMGCRERNRGNLAIPGPRPAGIFTAGLAQRLLNMEGYLPGKRAVIIGSGDIGLIMARRLSWCGAKVAAVVELLPHPSGLTRNIVQCLDDFSIPLHLGHTVTAIHGKDRVEAVTIAPIVNGVAQREKSRRIICDTLLLSVGLVPENELSRRAGVAISPDTNGPAVDHRLETGVAGIFACGNVLHVHDLVDFVSEEAEECGRRVVEFLRSHRNDPLTVPVRAGSSIKYVLPGRCPAGEAAQFFMRPLVLKEESSIVMTQGTRVIATRRIPRVRPAEMIRIKLDADTTAAIEGELPIVFSLGGKEVAA